jgi:branched-subunit amino acid transport protein
MSVWLVVVLAGIGTLALRLSFIIAAAHLRLPRAMDRAGDLIFPVAIAAILGVTVRNYATAMHPGQLVALAAAAVVTAVISRRTGSMLAALGAGLAVVMALSLVTG